MNAREIVRDAREPAIATDAANGITAWNRAARELFGFQSDRKVAGRSLHKLLQLRDLFGNPVGETGPLFIEMASRGEPVHGFEVSARKISGERLRLEISVVVVLGPEPARHEIVYLMSPVLHRRRADEAIERILADRESGREASRRAADGKGSAVGGVDGAPELTRRQLEVLRLVADGLDNREIAKALGVSVNTVRSHMQALLESLGVHSQVEAVAKAFRRNLL